MAVQHQQEYSDGVVVEPWTLKEAMRSPQASQWDTAMQEEIKSLNQMGTWQLIDRMPGIKVISAKWVYRIKTGRQGAIERFKARLVARGYSQIFGVDY